MPRVADIESKKPGVMRGLMQKAGARRLLGHDIPEAYGGLGGDKTSSSLITEAASRQGSYAVSFGAHVGIGTMPLVHFGTAEQRQKYLPKLASGEMIAAYALTEPGSGSDALAAKTKAVKSADGKSWKLTGSKLYITNAGFADLFTVFAKVDGEQFTAFLVERGAPGLTIGPEEHKLGIRGSSTCPLFLEDCTIPIENVLGTIGQGHKIAFNVLNIGRWKLGIGAVGGAKYCLELGVKFAARAQAVRQADRRVRSHPQEDRRDRHADLRRRVDGLPDGGPARRAGAPHRPGRPAGAEKIDRRHRGAQHRGVDHQGVRLGDPARHGRRDAADLRRRRLHRGLPDRARQPRRPHQPDLRGDQRDQPPAGPGDDAQARAHRAIGAHEAGGRGAAGAGRSDQDRSPAAGGAARARAQEVRLRQARHRLLRLARACRSTCRRSPRSRSCSARWPTR